MSAEHAVYSIQRTYIIKPISKSEKRILTCDQRIDIPTIEPLPSVKPVSYDGQPLTVIPCIELAGEFLSEFDLTFETNEGVTVLPIKIAPGQNDPSENPYTHFRYVLALPSGATGVKSCRLIHKATGVKSCRLIPKATGKEVQHNFTFGIMPPPYNYDNALFGYISYRSIDNSGRITELNKKIIRLENKTNNLKLVTKPPIYNLINLPKGAGKQTIEIANNVLYFWANFNYSPGSSDGHSPKITVSDGITTTTYTLTLYKSVIVTINLLSATITANVSITGEIVQQLKLFNTIFGYKTISFENFDDISDDKLDVFTRGVGVE